MKIKIESNGGGLVIRSFIGSIAIMLTLIATLFTLVNALDVIYLYTQYAHYDGVVVDYGKVRSEVEISKTKVTGNRNSTMKTITYKQDIVVSYNDKEVRKNDVSVSREGYSLRDKVNVYESNHNPDEVKIRENSPSKIWCAISLIGIVICWIFIVRKVIKVIKGIRNIRNNVKNYDQMTKVWENYNYLDYITEYGETEEIVEEQ